MNIHTNKGDDYHHRKETLIKIHGIHKEKIPTLHLESNSAGLNIFSVDGYGKLNFMKRS